MVLWPSALLHCTSLLLAGYFKRTVQYKLSHQGRTFAIKKSDSVIYTSPVHKNALFICKVWLNQPNKMNKRDVIVEQQF